MEEPAGLLKNYCHLLKDLPASSTILDLACGDGQNGIFLARKGFEVAGCDVSREALDRAKGRAKESGVRLALFQTDLEKEGAPPLPADAYGGILVFKYLHRPLIPFIKRAIQNRGFLFYETFTEDQRQFGRPRNPAHLLRKGELRGWFRDWQLCHYFEGIKSHPDRAVAQLVCRKPPSFQT